MNIAGRSVHPLEIMDLSFAVRGLGAHYLVNTPMAPGVHVLPRAVCDSIAEAKLASMGITLDAGRLEQADDQSNLIGTITL